MSDVPQELGSPSLDRRPLPAEIVRLFWDISSGALNLHRHERLLARRVLNEGSWWACCWLRAEIGDDRIRRHLETARGRGFERRSLRLWQVLLGIPKNEVDGWLAEPERRLWDQRTS